MRLSELAHHAAQGGSGSQPGKPRPDGCHNSHLWGDLSYVGIFHHPDGETFAGAGEVWIDIPFPAECVYHLNFYYGRLLTTLGFDLSEWMVGCSTLPSEELPVADLPFPGFASFRETVYCHAFAQSANLKEIEWETLTAIVSHRSWVRFEDLCRERQVKPLHELMLFTWSRPGFITAIEEHQRDYLNDMEVQCPSPH